MAPLFITFEGLDGSGKSTHLRHASEWLTGRGIPHRVTHEPGGTPLEELYIMFRRVSQLMEGRGVKANKAKAVSRAKAVRISKYVGP